MTDRSTDRSSRTASNGLVRAFELAAVLAAIAYVAIYVAVASQRVAYPFELEWMEGGTLQHLSRVLRGKPLFVAPSIEFVPFPYPPFYYYLAAALSPLFGEGFFTLRLISLASSLGAALLVFRWVARDTGNAAWGVACAGTFVATWRASGLYFDVARLDSLFAFLLLLWLYGMRFHATSRGLVASAVAAFLAVMTKQTGAVVVVPIACWCVVTDWSRNGRSFATLRRWKLSRSFALPVALLGAGGTLLLDGVVDEHFLRHVVGAQSQHGILPWKIGLFLGGDLFATLPFASLFALAGLALGARARRGASGIAEPTASVAFHAIALVGILLACMVPRIKVSGAANNLIPAHAFVSVLFGVGLARVRDFLAQRDRPPPAATVRAALALCCVAQLAVLFHWPRGYVPTAADRAAGERFVSELRRVDGDVLIPGEGYLAVLAGKRAYAHQMPVSDYAKSGLPDAPALQSEYRRAVRDGRFAAIVDSNTQFVRRYVGEELLEAHYRMTGWAFPDATVFLPISGAQIRPGKIWARRSEADADAPAPATAAGP